MKKYILEHKKKAVWGLVIFFVASLSFGLGYVADRQFNHVPIIIEKCSD